MVMLSGSLMAQDSSTSGAQSSEKKMPKRNRITYEQMTEKMVKELQLDEKQQKKVAKLNKKYKTLIEGEQVERPQGQRPPMGERPSGRLVVAWVLLAEVCKEAREVAAWECPVAVNHQNPPMIMTSNNRSTTRLSPRS